MSENQNNNVEFTSNKDQHLKRSLKARHMNMIAFRWRYRYRVYSLLVVKW